MSQTGPGPTRQKMGPCRPLVCTHKAVTRQCFG